MTAALGFSAAGVACGIKNDGELDLAVIVADDVVPAAGVFTSSTTAAPPVEVSRRHLEGGTARVVVVNSGCANAGTGTRGLQAAMATAEAAASTYGCVPQDVLICSTGTIGPQLPVQRLIEGLPSRLGRNLADGSTAAAAILTTDSVIKESVAAASGWTVGGMAKGAGMVRPDMATMLAVLTTDAIVAAADLQRILTEAVDVTFNALNVDGCQSTNDTVLMLASGASGVAPDLAEFADAVASVCADLAQQIAADAEGASRVVTIRVTGARDDAQARMLGKIIADSDLVRSSFYGGDPNWGRIFAALGTAGVAIEPAAIDIAYESIGVAAAGVAVGHDAAALEQRLAVGDFTVEVNVGSGPGRAGVLTTDLTPEYVRFNGERS